MSAAEETKAVLDVAVNYTKQIVDALTPIAKQGYEVGLTTLRIDAVSDLVVAFLLILIFCVGAVSLFKWVEPRRGSDEGEGAFVVTLFLGASFIAWAFSIWHLFSVWIWVKLFHPDLWLAHMAIEKILK